MTTKATIKMAQDLLDRFFREAEGKTNRQIDVYFVLEDMGIQRDKAEEGLEYLTSRALVNMFGPDIAFLTEGGVNAIASEQSLAKMPKVEREFAKSGPQTTGIREKKETTRPPPAEVEPEPETPGVPPPSQVTPHTDRAMLTFVDADGQHHVHELGWNCTIGRVEGNTIHLADQRASKKHAELKYDNGKYVVSDLGAANGTLVNGAYIDTHILRHCDSILIGRTTLLYECPEVIRAPKGRPEAAAQESASPAPKAAQVVVEPAATERPRREATAPPPAAPSQAQQPIRVVKGRPESQKRPPQVARAPQQDDSDLFDTMKGQQNAPKIPPFPRHAQPEDPHDLFAQASRAFDGGAANDADDLFGGASEPKKSQARSTRPPPDTNDLFGGGGRGDRGAGAPSDDLFAEPKAKSNASLFEEPRAADRDIFAEDQRTPPPRGRESADLLAELPIEDIVPADEPYDPLLPPSMQHGHHEVVDEGGNDATIMRPAQSQIATDDVRDTRAHAPVEEEPWNEERTPTSHVHGGGHEHEDADAGLLDNVAIAEDMPELDPADFEAAQDPTPIRPNQNRGAQHAEEALSTVLMERNDIFTDEELAAARGRPRGEDEQETAHSLELKEQETFVGNAGPRAPETRAKDAKKDGQTTDELPRWGEDRAPQGTHPPFAPGRDGSAQARSRAMTEHAAAEDLPEASISLADVSLPAPLGDRLNRAAGVAATGERAQTTFHRTLRALRSQVERADLPDREALLEAIDMLERHPYIRVAVLKSEDRPER